MRIEIRLTQQFAEEARAAALGDAAVRLAALELLGGDEPGRVIVSGEYELAGRRVAFRILPAAGFVNLNAAPETLLRDLLVHGGRLEVADAALLARRIVAWRTADPVGPDDDGDTPGGPAWHRRTFFAAADDVLQVPGVDLDLFDRLRPLVTVYGPRDGGVDPLVAKPEVLVVLARGDEALARQIATRRDSEGLLTDTTRLEQSHLSPDGSAFTYRIEAFVPDADGRYLLRAHWIALRGHQRLPWRTLTIEPLVAMPAPLP
jgi:general secretion pathway protein K